MSIKISIKKLREFGFIMSFLFPLFIGWFFPFIVGNNFKFWTLCVGCLSFIFATYRPKLLYYPYILWMHFGKILGWLNSRLILGMIFFSVLLPISILMKVFGHDPLRKKKFNQKSYRELKINHKFNFKKIF